MPATILDGRAISAAKRRQLKEIITAKRQQGARAPGLAVVLVGDNPASEIYVRNKKRACEEVGIRSFGHSLAPDITELALLELIDTLNQDDQVDGILVQLPLPGHISTRAVLERISPNKDVDGFHPFNLGRLAQNDPSLRSCTPYGVMMMLEAAEIPLAGLDATIIGMSNIVGRPMSLELLGQGVTVTCCHRRTQNLAAKARAADLLVVATGQPHLVAGDWVKPGAVVIDIGINRLEDGKLVGDVDFAAAAAHASWITPVPGGVGPMTIVALLQNTLNAFLHFTPSAAATKLSEEP